MKRWISVILAIMLTLSHFSAFANANPDKSTDFFGSIGSFFGDAWECTTKAVDEVWDDTSKVVGDAWKDVSDFSVETWDWASGAIAEQYNAASESTTSHLNNLSSWISITGDNALNTLHEVFNLLAGELGIAGDKATKLWAAIEKYAEDNNIKMVEMAKLTLAIMVRLTLSGTLAGDMAGEYISDTIIAWFSNNGIDSEEDAEKALAGLEDSLNA